MGFIERERHEWDKNGSDTGFCEHSLPLFGTGNRIFIFFFSNYRKASFHCSHLSKKFQIFTARHKSNVFRSEAKIRLTKLSPNAYLPAKRDCMRNIVLSKLYEFLRAFSAFHFVRIYGNNAELYSLPLHDLPSANNWASKSLFFDSFIRLCVRK